MMTVLKVVKFVNPIVGWWLETQGKATAFSMEDQASTALLVVVFLRRLVLTDRVGPTSRSLRAGLVCQTHQATRVNLNEGPELVGIWVRAGGEGGGGREPKQAA